MPQFLIKDTDLDNFYDCIKGYGNPTEALTLLSKPEDEDLPRDHVYDDYLILTLTDDQVEELITYIAEEEGPASFIVTLARSIKKGLLVRSEEDMNEDDEESR
jgi:hypothetical protein